MAKIEFSKITKNYGATPILKGLDLQIESGEFLVLVGPSGCGKSTLLRTIAGLENLDGGEIRVNGQVINSLPPQKRDVAMVFQNYALYPHLNVFENIGFALTLLQRPKSEISKRVQTIAELLKIENLLSRKPKDLSGGQRQRVALGRALARETSIILFDEPLSNLDAHLRGQMRLEIKRLHQKLKSTMVYVTHDQMEATTMGDRIVILKDGQIEQAGTPSEVYHQPANLFVASFIGSPEMNFIEGSFLAKLPIAGAASQDLILGVRPEALKVAEGAPLPGEFSIGQLQVELCENLGGQQMLHGQIEGHRVRVLADSLVPFQKGQSLAINLDLTKAHLFDKVTGHNQKPNGARLT